MIDEVKQKIEILDAINEEEITPNILPTIENLKDVEDKFVSKKIRGSLLRSKLPGVEEGDLNAAYYSKLEKMRAEQNTIFSLMNKNGELVEGTNKISEVIYDFYNDLYTKEIENEKSQDDFLKGVKVKLSQEERDKLDEDFTEDELKASMKDLNKYKRTDTYFLQFLQLEFILKIIVLSHS